MISPTKYVEILGLGNTSTTDNDQKHLYVAEQ
jgi:hypothetical protein